MKNQVLKPEDLQKFYSEKLYTVIIGNIIDRIIDLHADCTEKLKRTKRTRAKDRQSLLVLSARRNAIQDCLSEVIQIRNKYRK